MIVQAGWIDIDTPVEKRTTISKIDGTIYQLVRYVRQMKKQMILIYQYILHYGNDMDFIPDLKYIFFDLLSSIFVSLFLPFIVLSLGHVG
jgi:hypothetical protein